MSEKQEPYVSVRTESGQEFYIPASQAATGKYRGEAIVGGGKYYDPSTGTLTNVDVGKGVIETTRQGSVQAERPMGEWVDPKTGLGYSGPQKSPNDLPAGMERGVSISTQKAYEAGAISRTAKENYERSGAYELAMSEQMLSRAREASRAYPIEKNPETHSSLQMAQRQQRFVEGQEQQKEDIIKAKAAEPSTGAFYELGHGPGTLFSFAESRITGKSFDVWQQERQQNIEAFTRGGYKAAEKGWTDETWLWSLSESRESVEAAAFLLFPEAGALAFVGMGIAQAAHTIKEPSQENMARSFLYAGTALATKSVDVMGGSMKAAYSEWRPPKGKAEPMAKGFELKGTEVAESKVMPEDTGLLIARSVRGRDELRTTGNLFIITEDVGKISKPTLELREVPFKAVTKLAEENMVVKTDISFGDVSRPAGKSMSKMIGAGKMESVFSEKFEVQLTKADLIQIGRTRQQTLLGKELPKLELSEVLSFGKKANEFTDFEIMQVRKSSNQPTRTYLSHRVVRIDTLLKMAGEKETLEISWIKAGDIKLSRTARSAFQERLKTQGFEPLPKWPGKEWKGKWEVSESWPSIDLLKAENMAKLQMGFDEAMKSFVSGVTRNKPGPKIAKLEDIPKSAGTSGGFMRRFGKVEASEIEEVMEVRLKPGDIKGMGVPELKEAAGLKIGPVFSQKTGLEQMARQMERTNEKSSLRMGMGSAGKLDIKQEAMTMLGQEKATKQETSFRTGLKQEAATLLGLKTKQDVTQKFKMRQTGMRAEPVIPRPRITETVNLAKGFGAGFPTGKGKKGRRLTAGFKVFARRFGKWFELSPRPLSKSQAFGMGARYTMETPGATFKVRRVDAMVEDVDDPFWRRTRHQFGKPVPRSRLGPEAQIEKSKFRIDMPGERQGITEKGIEAARMARMRRNMFNQRREKPTRMPDPSELLFGRKGGKKKRRKLWGL